MTFPSETGIRTWQQHADLNETGANVDADEWMLSRVATLWSDNCDNQDLKNVAIISDGRLSIRFVDLRMVRNKGRKDVIVKRGDLVVFLYPTNDVAVSRTNRTADAVSAIDLGDGVRFDAK